MVPDLTKVTRVLRSGGSTRVMNLAQAGFIDHVGIGVPDLAAAKEYYDDLMSVLGLRDGSRQGLEGHSTTGRTVLWGHSCSSTKQKNRALTPAADTGLHHLAFLVASRAIVREAHQWARSRDAVILDEPQGFAQYGPHCFATYWLDPHGFKLEAVCHSPDES